MATLIPRVAVWANGAWSFYVPPYKLAVDAQPILDVVITRPPFANMRMPYGRIVGWKLGVAYDYYEDSIGEGLGHVDALMEALFDGPAVREVAFCRFVDTTGVINRIWRSCVCTAAPVPSTGTPGDERHRRVAFELTALDPVLYNTGPGGDYPGISPYETHYSSGETGTTYVPMAQIYDVTLKWDDLVEQIAAGNAGAMQKRFRVDGGAGTMKVKNPHIVSCGARTGGSGTTRFILSNAAWDAEPAGDQIVVDLAHDADQTAAVLESINVGNGGYVYCWPALAAGHGGVEMHFKVRSS
jgi:hypothetical protein